MDIVVTVAVMPGNIHSHVAGRGDGQDFGSGT